MERNPGPDTIAELLVAYRSHALAWDALGSDANKANPVFVQLHSIYKQLRTEPAGREGITTLMDDDNQAVRLSAAAHSLAWAREKAEKVLTAIESGPGLYAVSAKYTLKAFREGTLNLDW